VVSRNFLRFVLLRFVGFLRLFLGGELLLPARGGSDVAERRLTQNLVSARVEFKADSASTAVS
jgi:hypothetical protein